MPNTSLERYAYHFRTLNRAVTYYGYALHKPILLLTILELMEQRAITDNKFYYAQIESAYKANFNKFSGRKGPQNLYLPFFHLSREPFWNLKYKNSFRETDLFNPKSRNNSPSKGRLTDRIYYAYFDEELFSLLTNLLNITYLKSILVECYFENFDINSLGFEKDLIIDLQREVRYGIRNTEKRLIPMRNLIFRKEILSLYNYRCCLSGISASIEDRLIVDACHIDRFIESQKDIATNGIALNPFLHRAFDNFCFTLDKDFRVLISPKLKEEPNGFINIKDFNRMKINLPINTDFYPDQTNLEKHRKRFFEHVNG